MTTKFTGEVISCVRWLPTNYTVLDKPTYCITASSGSNKSSLNLWDCTGEKIQNVSTETLDSIPANLAFISPSHLVLGSEFDPQTTPTLDIWTISDKSKFHLSGKLPTKNSITTSVDAANNFICSVGEDGHVEVHMEEQQNTVYGTWCNIPLHSVTFYLSHNILVGTASGQVQNYDIRISPQSGAQSVMCSDIVSIFDISVHPSQPCILASARSDGSLIIWDMRNNRYPLATFAGHTSTMWEIQFQPDKPDNLYSCSEDGQLLLWNGAGLNGLSGSLANKTNISPWLTPEVSHEKMNVFNLLGSDDKLSVNSFDVINNSLVCGGDRQTLFYLENFED